VLILSCPVASGFDLECKGPKSRLSAIVTKWIGFFHQLRFIIRQILVYAFRQTYKDVDIIGHKILPI
jgi:hypothetical protein